MESTSDTFLVDFIVAGMLLAFILATAIILFVFFYQRKVNAQKSKLQMVKIQHQEALIHATLKAVEEERQQFAANLHDEVGAHLSIAKMTLSNVSRSDEQKNTPIGSAVTILEEAISSVQSISHNLFPPVLAKLGLEKAIESYLTKIPSTTINIDFISGNFPERFDQEVELHAFRIFQESISNAIKHSGGSQILIELTPRNKALSLKISDNGKGINNKNGRIGLGLQGMQSRAEMIGYDFNLTSTTSGVSIQIAPKTP